ncbi:protein of unknown function [Hymenobacter gelipurpurascens]|uniref:DUF4259 domain-containing protein n=1 Tax=Hymenobacter gelipurpurascens TaxID=89968 RepID=A0A212TA87_9BACT|nr:DUF4259 domain-containing protein [Hymenobacter gelipurpurascens]SNC62958.1 protein of unknown function [Hymenobacter gelipurpurascens]
MSTWGYYNFDNDLAADLAAKFRDTHSLGLLSEALADIPSAETIGNDAAQEALAAAELVAALLGKPGEDLPADLLPITVQLNPAESTTLQGLAREAVQAVSKRSDLQAHWTKGDNKKEWQQRQQDLLHRLQ